MSYVVQHPNGEFISSNWHGHIETCPSHVLYAAKRYNRQVARQMARSIPGAMAVKYTQELADAAYEAWVESQRPQWEAWAIEDAIELANWEAD